MLLTVDEATHAVIEESAWEVNILYYRLLDNYSTMVFSPPEDLESFWISLNARDALWKKEFYYLHQHQVTDKHLFNDHARYARLLLNLIQSFDIIEIGCESLTSLDKHCLAAKIINVDSLSNFRERIFYNIYFNNSLVMLSAEAAPLSIDSVINFLRSEFTSDNNVEFYVTTQNIITKLIVSWEVITLYPLEPVRAKTIERQTLLDSAFYVRLLLGICENYAIVELKTTFGEVDS